MKILVIESELQTRRLLHICLEREGYEVVEATTGIEGIDETVRTCPSAILMELKLPDMEGLVVLKRLRELTQVPVLIVSDAREGERIAALDGGANDHIGKPFNTGELLARLRVARQMAQPSPEPPASLRCGSLEVDTMSHTVVVRGRKVELTSTEHSLLTLFIKHTGKVLTHGFLLREIWGTTDAAKMGRLRVYMTQLREKLEENPDGSEMFLTKTGIGYRLVLREKCEVGCQHESLAYDVVSTSQ